MLTLLLKAITNLTRLGTIKSVQQAYQLAKRELGDKFNAAKKQIDDAFNQGKKEQTLDKRTKDIKKTEESGIKSLETGEEIAGLAKSKSKIEKEADKLKKVAEENKADPDEVFALKSDPVKTDTPLTQKLSKAVEEAKQQMKEIGSLSDAAMQKEQIRNALKALRDKRIYEMSSGLEGDVRTALRQFVKKEAQEGRLDIPDAYEKKMILEDRQGGVDPIDVFRKAYGEDALIAVDDIFEQYGNSLKGPTFKDIEENFRKLFKFNRGFYDMADLPVPKKEYGFEPGLQSVDTVEQDLINQYKQLDELDKFEPSTKRKPNANGGIMNSRIALDGGGSPLQKLKQEIVDSMKPYAPGVPESKLQIIVKDITLDMTPEEAQASAVSNFQKIFGMATGGRAGFSIGGKEGIMQMASVDDPFYRGGEEDEHSFRMFNKPYKELNEDELEEFREEMMRLMNKFAGLTETDYLKVKDMLDHYHRYKAMPQRKGSKTKKIPKPDFAKEFFRENNATGGRVLAASGGLADILKV